MLRSGLKNSTKGLPWKLTTLSSNNFASKTAKAKKSPQSINDKNATKSKKPNGKSDEYASSDSAASTAGIDADLFDEDMRTNRLVEDEKDKSLDIGANGRPLFTPVKSISQLSKSDSNSYIKFSMEELNAALPEGLPIGMANEFEDSKRAALLVRKSFLELRDNYRRVVDPPLRSFDSKGLKTKKQIVLDGPRSSGKSIALAMLVQWAREEGWLVFYVPKGRDWTHGGFFSKNPETGLWDTPVQAANALQDFMKSNQSRLRELPCQIYDPIPLGEGAGAGWMKGVDSMAMPEGSMIYDLIQTGLKYTQAAVGVVVRLRKELSIVKDVPVLIAIDEYNSWFTFSEYQESLTVHSKRPIHAREASMVNAFRCMMHNDMMIGAFSHSTAVGKLRKDLPDVPVDARVNFPRYSLDEAASVSHYYLRQRLAHREVFTEESWKKVYYLANGNGAEMRWLIPLMR